MQFMCSYVGSESNHNDCIHLILLVILMAYHILFVISSLIISFIAWATVIFVLLEIF